MTEAVQTYQPDPRILQARVTIARQLGITPDDVTIKIGRNTEAKYDDNIGATVLFPESKNTQELIITIHKQGLALDAPRMQEEIQTSLAALPPFSEVAQMVPEETLTLQLHDALAAAAEGTNFNKELLEWRGFHPKSIAEHDIGDFALENVRAGAYGVEVNLHFSEKEGEDKAAAIERFSELTKGRIESIRAILTERVIKYAKANIAERQLNAQEIDEVKKEAEAAGKDSEKALAAALQEKIAETEAQIREDMAKLLITINTGKRDNLELTLRSSEQQEAYTKALETNNEYHAPENADVLSNTNPLTSHVVSLSTTITPATSDKPATQPQLHKALARSILFDKDKNIAPDALQIFGRNDIKAAIIKEVVNKVSERKEAFEQILSSDLFKNHDTWLNAPGAAGSAKPAPEFGKAKSDDTIEMSFKLHIDKDPAKNQLKQVVEGLAALSNGEQQLSALTYAGAPRPQILSPEVIADAREGQKTWTDFVSNLPSSVMKSFGV